MNTPDIDTKVCYGCGKEYEPPILQQDADLCKSCHEKTLEDEHYVMIGYFDH
jgi:rRNA maturation endonuclease Nob1